MSPRPDYRHCEECKCSGGRLFVVGGVSVNTIEEAPLADDYPRAGGLCCKLMRESGCIRC